MWEVLHCRSLKALQMAEVRNEEDLEEKRRGKLRVKYCGCRELWPSSDV